MSDATHSIGRERALELADSHWWELCTAREIAEFQMFTRELCCPFDVFHKALEEALGRPVWTHELGLNAEGIRQELRGERDAPTWDEIVVLIPEEKRLIIEVRSPASGGE